MIFLGWIDRGPKTFTWDYDADKTLFRKLNGQDKKQERIWSKNSEIEFVKTLRHNHQKQEGKCQELIAEISNKNAFIILLSPSNNLIEEEVRDGLCMVQNYMI